MKQLILLSALLISFTNLAQTEKGSYYLSGLSNANFNLNRGFYYTEEQGLEANNIKQTQVQVGLSGGYFIVDNFAVGLIVNAARSKRFSGSLFNQEATNYLNQSISVGPSFSYFFHKESNWRPFVSTSVRYGRTRIDFEQFNATSKAKNLNIGLNAGIAYFISENWSINGGIQTLGRWELGENIFGTDDLDDNFGKSNFSSLNFSGALGLTIYF